MGASRKTLEQLEEQSDEDFKRYRKFRANIRLLRYTTDLSAEQMGKQLKFVKHYRYVGLETGKGGAPKLDEVEKIAEYFKVSIDDLLYKEAKVSFE